METVRLGDKVVPVVPQRHARLRHRLSPEDFQRIMSKDYGTESYRVLGILIPELPRLVPEYHWEGFPDQETWERWKNGDESAYDENADEWSPTTMEIVLAFEKALVVSGAGRLGKLIELIQTGQKMQEAQAQQADGNSTPSSPVSVGESGESG